MSEAAPAERLPTQYVVRAVTGLPDFRPGDDLAAAVCEAAPWLEDGDILAVTSKAVSKVEGRLVPTGTDEERRQRTRQEAIDDETVAVVAQRGGVRIVRTRQGMTMAAAGVDASNVNADEVALLPLDSDASAVALRARVRELTGHDVAVVVTDTVGRPWRGGLVDIALGAAGIPALRDLRGTVDTHGHPLAVTALAQIDEIASASELVRGKLGRVAVAVVRGIPWRDATDPVPGGAGSLIRPVEEDMFCLGARDVVPAAQLATGTGVPPRAEHLADALARVAAPDGLHARVAAPDGPDARAEGAGVATPDGPDAWVAGPDGPDTRAEGAGVATPDGLHARVAGPDGPDTRAEGARIVVQAPGCDPFETGCYIGQLTVALRAEGYATTVRRTGDGAVLEMSVAAPYGGLPR